MLFLQLFGILAEKARGVFFTVEVKTRKQEQILRLLLLEECVAIAIPVLCVFCLRVL